MITAFIIYTAQAAPFIINAVKFFAMFYQKLEFKKFIAQRGGHYHDEEF